MNLSTGENILFVDSDDYLEQNFLEMKYSPEFDMAICGYRNFGGLDAYTKPDSKKLRGPIQIADEVSLQIAHHYYRIP